ncbi:hypothetical protein Dimus_034991 [Dionaea muscipula]
MAGVSTRTPLVFTALTIGIVLLARLLRLLRLRCCAVARREGGTRSRGNGRRLAPQTGQRRLRENHVVEHARRGRQLGGAARDEHQRARYLRFGEVDRADHRISVLLDRKLRYDGRAEAFGDKTERGRTALDFVERVQRQAMGLQCAFEQAAVAAHFAGKDQRMRAQRFPAHAPPPRERMIVAADQHIGIDRERYADQFGMLVARDADAELRFASQHRLQHRRRRVVENLHAVVRTARGKRPQDTRQILDPDGRHTRNGHVAAQAEPRLADFRQRVRQFVQQTAGLRQEALPDLGERRAARRALDQRDAKIGFQLAQPLRDRRLRDVQRIGSLSEAAAVRDRDECLRAHSGSSTTRPPRCIVTDSRDPYATQYVQFEDERTRPVRDLLAAVPQTPIRQAIDIGCGPGNSTEALMARAPVAAVRGLDASPDMIAAARKRLPGLRFDMADIATWDEPGAYDLILANAVLQWLPAHETLFPRLIGKLAAGGHLAVQMPDNLDEPAHRLMREVAAAGPWAARLKGVERTERFSARRYHALLSPLCSRVDVWRTTYYHPLKGGADAVVEWFKGSALRPFLAALDDSEREAFVARYRDAVALGYPALDDGTVLLPFPRLFMVATRRSADGWTHSGSTTRNRPLSRYFARSHSEHSRMPWPSSAQLSTMSRSLLDSMLVHVGENPRRVVQKYLAFGGQADASVGQPSTRPRGDGRRARPVA